MRYLPRLAAASVRRLFEIFPIVALIGPRQCGKSTLARHEFPTWRHMDLERPRDLALLSGDLELFFDRHPGELVIDEAQYCPALFSVLRYVVDQGGKADGLGTHESRCGRFLLLGSANPLLVRSVSESLAGRIGFVELTPVRAVELAGSPLENARWFRGGFPGALGTEDPGLRTSWFEAYLRTILERDIPILGPRIAPARLRLLLAMLTHVHGALLNVSDLSRSLGLSATTVTAYLDLLEGAFLIRRLQPYHANLAKRLVKSPKVYIRDSGLLHHLANLVTGDDLETWSRRGASFEGFLIEELIAGARERLPAPEFYFFRTHAGAEVDLVVASGRRLIPIEMKLGTIPHPRELAGLRTFMDDCGADRGYIVSRTDRREDLAPGITVVPWREALAGGCFDEADQAL